MFEKKISFIVPVYNAESTIERCINSILSQSYTNIELLLIDDGSIDNTRRICEAFLYKDERIKYFYKNNSGVSDTRNFGLSLCTGDYVSFVDADDYIEPHFCDDLSHIIIEKDVDIAYGGTRDVYVDKCILSCSNTKNVFVFDSLDFEFYGEKRHEVVWGAIYKKNILNNLFFDKNIYIAEDTLFFTNAVTRAKSIAYFDSVLYNYVIYENSASHSIEFSEKKITRIEAHYQICEVLKNTKNGYLSAKTSLCEVCLDTLKTYKNNLLFIDKYKKKIVKLYRTNLKFLIKYYFMKKKFKSVIKHCIIYLFLNLYIVLM